VLPTSEIATLSQSYGISKVLSTIMLAKINQVHVAQQRISLTVHILLLNPPTLLAPKGWTLNREGIVSASQIMVNNA
jgi:hypothetical protein